MKMSKKLFPILYRKKDSELVNFFITINFIYIYIFFFMLMIYKNIFFF